MAEQLSIELTAKIDNFRDNFRAAVKEINTSDKEIRSKLSSIDKGFVDLANHVERSLGGKVAGTVKSASNSVSKDLAKVAQSAASSGQAVSKSATNYLNFGRIIQDLPFGLIGIQNNLTQLIPSVGAWGLAFTALTTALTFAQTGLSNWTRGLDGNESATKKAKKATDDYADSLDSVSQAQLKGEKNAQKEITELNTLYGITQDLTMSSKLRNQAVDSLQEQYPSYFGNLKNETILNGGAKEAYDRLTTSIIATGKARAAQDIITKNSARQLDNERKLIDLQTESDKLAITSAKLRKDAEDEIGSTRDLLLNRAIAAEGRRTEIYREQNNLKTDSNLLDKDNERLTKSVTQQIKKGADLIDEVAGSSGKKMKTLADIMSELSLSLEKTSVQFLSTFGERNQAQIKAYQSAIDSATESFGAQSKAVQDLIVAQQKLLQLPSIKTGSALIGVLPEKNTAKVGGKEDTSLGANLSKESNDLAVQYATILEKQDKFNADFQKGFENLQSASIAEAIGGGFSAIGEAMVSGGNIIEAAGSALMGTLSQFLNELGGMLVKKGLATVLAGTALNFLFPGSGAKTTAGGFALIAAGAALSLGSGVISGIGGKGSNSTNNNSNVTAFANGGIISGPTLGLMGEYSGAKTNPEVVAPLNKLKSMLGDQSPRFEVIQYIEADKLAVMVRNSNQRTGRI